MRKTILSLVLFGYGFIIEYWNFKHLGNKDGSLSKYEFELMRGNKYSNPFILVGWGYFYSLVFKLSLNKQN